MAPTQPIPSRPHSGSSSAPSLPTRPERETAGTDSARHLLAHRRSLLVESTPSSGSEHHVHDNEPPVVHDEDDKPGSCYGSDEEEDPPQQTSANRNRLNGESTRNAGLDGAPVAGTAEGVVVQAGVNAATGLAPQLEPAPECYVSCRNGPSIIVVAPAQSPGYDHSRPFRSIRQSRDYRKRRLYLDGTQRPLTAAADQRGERSEYQLVFFKAVEGGHLFTVNINGSMYFVKLVQGLDALRKEAVAQLDAYFGIGHIWPQLNATNASHQLGKPCVPLPLMILPPATARLDNFCGLLTEFTAPLGEVYRRHLVRHHLGPQMLSYLSQRPDWKDLTIHPYMGVMQSMPSKFDPKYRNLGAMPGYFNALCHEAPKKIICWGLTMGRTLAALHWLCGLDAAGVEFYFAQGRYSSAQLCLAQFRHCRSFDSSIGAVDTRLVPAVSSSPSWPRPKTAPSFRDIYDRAGIVTLTWNHFCAAYKAASETILTNKGAGRAVRALPAIFISRLETFWAQHP